MGTSNTFSYDLDVLKFVYRMMSCHYMKWNHKLLAASQYGPKGFCILT
jgi:hypothetical protein